MRSPRSRAALLLLSLLPGILALAGCVTADSPGVRDVLDTEIVTFAPGEVPEALVQTLSARRVILLGETHYVQEHQEFVLELLRRLHPSGLRWFTQEMAHAYSWIVEDYVLGLRDDYPESARRMDEYWIEGLRSFNEELPEAERIRMRYMDMNHAPDAFVVSLSWMVHRTPVGTLVGPLASDVLATTPGTEAYAEAVAALADRLGAEADALMDELGPWYGRLAEAVWIEIRSLPLRREHDVHARERIMIDLAEATIDESAGAAVAINVGMYHAQRRRYMGTRQEWLGEYLAAHADRFGGDGKLYSIAFWGFEGERIRWFMDTDPQPVPLAIERPTSNLSRQIAETVARRDGGNRPQSAAFLNLSHPVFARRMRVAFTHSPLPAVPGRQFDAYVVFPEISVLESIRRSW